MPVQSTLTLNAKAYAPRGKVNGDEAKWVLSGDASFGGATSTVLESVRGPSKDGVTRVRFRLDIPKAASDDSPCGCAGQLLDTGRLDLSLIIPATFTAAERADFTDRVQALVAHAVFTAAGDNLEGSW